MENENMELLCLQIITNAGEARSECMAALVAASEGKFDEADSSIKAAEESRKLAHHVHSQLITMDAGGELKQLNLILVHSEDIMMGAEITYSMAVEMVKMYRKLAGQG